MSKRACLPCRARKVKCIPNSRRCQRCTNLGIEACVYDGIKKRGPGGTLGMGEACTSCRRKKRKCDAKRPCTTCANSGRGSGCFYEELRFPHHVIPHAAHPFPFSDEDPPGLSNDGSFSYRSFGAGEDVPDAFESPRLQVGRPVQLGRDALGSSSADPVDWDPTKLPSTSHTFQGFDPFVSGGIKRYVRSRPLRSTTPSTSSELLVLPSLRLSIVPRPIHTPLSFFPPQRFQVAEGMAGDFEMSCRLTALLQYSKLGIYLTQDKQEALLNGNTSNTTVNSLFVYQACSYGMLYYAQHSVYAPAALRFQARYSQLAWEELAKVQKGNDDYLKAQTMLSISSCCIVFRWVDFSRQYTQKACHVINAAGLQFIPAYGQPPDYSELVRERSAVLSQVMYFENYLFLAYGGQEPKSMARIEKEFRCELQRVYPVLFKICPLTMRAQAILLVRDAVPLLNVASDDAHESNRWRRSCDRLIPLLDEYSNTLLRNLQRFIEIGDNTGAEIIWSSCIISLTHLTALCELVGRMDPTAGSEMNRICDCGLEKLGHLTEDVRSEEYTHLDLLLGFSWRKSLAVYESRISGLPMEDSLLLRYLKGVVAKAHLTFQERLPDEEPPELTSKLCETDGRDEDSEYPNLLQASVRDDYGI